MAKASVKNLDFTNVKEGGAFNTKRIEAGDYLAKIMKVEDTEVKSGDNKGQAQYLFTIRLVDQPSIVFPYYCQLNEKMLWKLRNILVAAGKSVPKKRMKVDPNSIVGKLIGVVVEDDEHDGKERSRIEGVFPPSDLPDAPDTGRDEDEDEPEDEEEDAPLEDEAPEVDEPDEEEEDEEAEPSEADRLAGLNRNQLKAEIKTHQADFQAKKSQSDDDLRDILAGLISGDDEEEEDEAPAPAPKKTAAKPAASKAKKTTTKKAVEAVTDDELDELDIDSL